MKDLFKRFDRWLDRQPLWLSSMIAATLAVIVLALAVIIVGVSAICLIKYASPLAVPVGLVLMLWGALWFAFYNEAVI